MNILYFLWYQIYITTLPRLDDEHYYPDKKPSHVVGEIIFALLTPNFCLADGIVKLYVKSGITDLCQRQLPDRLNEIAMNKNQKFNIEPPKFTDAHSVCNSEYELMYYEKLEWPAKTAGGLCCWFPTTDGSVSYRTGQLINQTGGRKNLLFCSLYLNVKSDLVEISV